MKSWKIFVSGDFVCGDFVSGIFVASIENRRFHESCTKMESLFLWQFGLLMWEAKFFIESKITDSKIALFVKCVMANKNHFCEIYDSKNSCLRCDILRLKYLCLWIFLFALSEISGVLFVDRIFDTRL